MDLPLPTGGSELGTSMFIERICKNGCQPKGSDMTLSSVKEGSAYAEVLWHIQPTGLTTLRTVMVPHLPVEILNPANGKPKWQRQRRRG